MFYFVYVLISSQDKNFYTGFTNNLEARIKRHNNGEVSSTRDRRPLDLIFYEAYLNKSDALRREKYFKTTKGKATLRVMLDKYLEEAKKDKSNSKEKNKKRSLLLK